MDRIIRLENPRGERHIRLRRQSPESFGGLVTRNEVSLSLFNVGLLSRSLLVVG